MIPSRRPGTTRKAAIFSAAIVCGLSLGSVQSSAQTPGEAITISGEPILGEEVMRALKECQTNASELPGIECLDRYWVPRWLLDTEAKKRNLLETAGILQKRKDILATRLLEILAEQADEPSPLEIESYLRKHERDFKKPLRIRIFRILVSTEEKAKDLLGKLSHKTSISDFRKLARDHSLDRATNERGGDLGFVWPDGSTDIPQVSAEPALYAAALELVDGEFSKAPVQEGKHFAVLWRRGTLPAQDAEQSNARLARLRLLEIYAEQRRANLLAELTKKVVGRDDDLLGKLRRAETTLFREP